MQSLLIRKKAQGSGVVGGADANDVVQALIDLRGKGGNRKRLRTFSERGMSTIHTGQQWSALASQDLQRRRQEDADGEDSDDENTSSGSNLSSQLSSQGVRPLQKLISQQAKEIEDMSVRLENAEAKVASQSSQLNTWRRRMESNPTQLDHMLNDFTLKNSDLEEKVRSLGLEIERQQSDKDKEIKAMQESKKNSKPTPRGKGIRVM